MKAVIYLRQSLDRTGSGAAVDRQRDDCLRLCSERGWEVVEKYIDNDVSASSRKPRPAYGAMLAAVESGSVDVIVAWHVDRLTRRLTELEELIELAQRTGIRIATVTGDLDLSNDAGRLVGRILASVARGEIERKGARQKKAQQQAAEQGKPAGGRRPFGYGVMTGATKLARGVQRPVYDINRVNDAEAELVREAYADLLKGASLKSIARRWNDLGALTTAGNPWTHSSVRDTLKNPRYAGLRTYRGEVVGPAIWPPLIDAETHQAVCALLALPSRRTTLSTARKHLLPALALCGVCGSDVATGHTRHGKRVYVCRAKKCISRAAEPVDALIAGGTIDGVETRGVVVERLSLPDALELLSDGAGPELDRLRRQRDGVQERLDDLAVGLEEGILTLSAVRTSSTRLRAERDKIDAQIADATRADVLGPLATAGDVAAAWAGYDLQQRRAVIDSLMTVTLLKPKAGRRDFDPATISVSWRTGV